MAHTRFQTHRVFNQSSDFAGYNALRTDPLLRVILADLREPILAGLERHGRFCGSYEAHDLARLANQQVPSLRRFDEKGRRLELVDHHPAYHALMRRSVADGLHASIWSGPAEEAGFRHRVRAARFFMTAGVECGHLCPITMTSAALAALEAEPPVREAWLPVVASRQYDPGVKAPLKKAGATFGMGMTEKQGGTDVRANTTRAEPGEADGWFRVTGHKWFLSAPMSDAFLVTAQTAQGPTCFLLPRRLSDGSLNGLHIQRLKDKLGNRANASAEVEFDDADARRIGEEGRGIRTILTMVTLTRADCALASAGLMRGALAQAVHHAREREVFGKPLAGQPLMARVLADMALDVAGATALAFRQSEALDARDEEDAGQGKKRAGRETEPGASPVASEAEAWVRVMTPVAKYWICKTAPPLVAEAMECLGGNGYVEDGRLARAYREAPVNAIWEGSGNVMALDLGRVLAREPESFDTVVSMIERDLEPDRPANGTGGESGTGAVLRAAARMARSDEGALRLLIEQLALAGAAASLRRLNAGVCADAFAQTRLGGVFRQTYGMLDHRYDPATILDDLYLPIG